MPSTLKSLGLDRLPIEERIALASDLRESIEAETEVLPLAQRDEIDRRLAAHRADPDAAIPWERVEAEALARVER